MNTMQNKIDGRKRALELIDRSEYFVLVAQTGSAHTDGQVTHMIWSAQPAPLAHALLLFEVVKRNLVRLFLGEQPAGVQMEQVQRPEMMQ